MHRPRWRERMSVGRNKEAELWIDQLKRRHMSGEHKARKTSADASIYRVPESVKKTKHEAYEPLVVFLGPYHHKKHQQLTAVDEYKLQAVDRTLERLSGMNIELLVSEVREIEREIRVCYEDSAAEWDGDSLAWIMTMDACFILEVFRMDLPNSNLIFHFQRDFNIKRREIISDIMKLENQIPFFILKKILELELKDPVAVRDFLAKNLLQSLYFQGYPFSIEIENVISILPCLIEGGPHHLLDLSRQVIAGFLSDSDSESAIVDDSIIPSAEKLQKAGIKLKASTESKFYFKRTCFQGSTLFVPRIIVEDYTEIFLRNLLAFEQCQLQTYAPIKRVISRNMCLMDQLINTEEDVKLFHRADIIKNYLGTEDEVAKIFNDLCIGVTREHCYQHVLKLVNDRYKSPYKSQLNVWINEFREEHCSKPWYIVSFVVAVLLLVMTLLQTIYTMKD